MIFLFFLVIYTIISNSLISLGKKNIWAAVYTVPYITIY